MKRYSLTSKFLISNLVLLLALVSMAACTAAPVPTPTAQQATSTPTAAPRSVPTATPTEAPPAPTATQEPAATATPTPQVGPAAGVTIAIPLKEENNSGQTGVAVLTAVGDRTEVVLMATAGISRANHIHTGTCADLGGVAHALTNMENGGSTTVVDVPLESLLTGGFAINLHNAQTASIYTSCGDIPAMGRFVSISLNEQNNSGQSGTATLLARGEATDVVLVATPGMSRANHIHSGTCAELGGVVHGLTNMADGVSVTTVDVPLASLGTGGFAINLHNAQTSSIYTACANIPTAAFMAAQGADLVIPLFEQNSSGQTGVAVLTARGDRTEIVLQATSGISRANHVHSGSCENLGGVVHGLTNMADGISVTTISVPLNSLLTGGFAINLHHVDTASIWTACGDLPASDAFVTIALEEENESGQTGVATLMARGNVTDVALVATHGISWANHIHTGNCGPTLGGVAHGLTNMANGLSITTVDATLSSLRTGGFAINLHNAQTASIYTACGDIPAAGVATTGASSPAPTPTPTPPVFMDDYDDHYDY